MPTDQKADARSVKTPRGLGCYVFLDKPREGMNGGEAAYSISLLFPKTADLSRVKAAILAAAQEKWGNQAQKGLDTGKLRNPLRDGDEKFEESGDATFKSMVFMNAKNSYRPTIVDTNLAPVDPKSVYSGCYFHAAIRFFAYDKNGNKGVGASLSSLMLVHKGDRIDGRKSAEQEFSDFKPETQDGDQADSSGDLF